MLQVSQIPRLAADPGSIPVTHEMFACRCRRRYSSYDELYGYCYKVAGTVALMTTPVMGINPAYDVRLSCSHGFTTSCTSGCHEWLDIDLWFGLSSQATC